MRCLISLMVAVAMTAVFCGCCSVVNEKSITFKDPAFNTFGPVCTVMSAPLSGDFKACADSRDLKKGTSSEVVFFQFEEPIAAIGNESIKSAMEDGGIKELYYADYSVRFFLILGWYTVTAYGK